MDYYNEFDEYPLQWLRNLQAAGHIPDGVFDGRSIVDVQAEDVKAARQAHFFAGIGGWPLALKLAGWPEDQEVWTGSCPCQPFSVAGARKGKKDKRHLWPDFFRLIRECLPPVVFGEQVASKEGRAWLHGVRHDLESVGYEVGAADLCAASAGEEGEGWILRGDRVFVEPTIIGAPHLRQRLFWVAKSKSFRYRSAGLESVSGRRECAARQNGGDVAVRLADSERPGLEGLREQYAREERETAERGGIPRGVADRQEVGCGQELQDGRGESEGGSKEGRAPGSSVRCPSCGLAHNDAEGRRLLRSRNDETGGNASGGDADGRVQARPVADSARAGAGDHEQEQGRRAASTPVPYGEAGGMANADGGQPGDGGLQPGRQYRQQPENAGAGRWSRFDVLPCSDQRARRVESGTFPLAHGVPGRVGKLRAYGNAIVSELAADFIKAFLECSTG